MDPPPPRLTRTVRFNTSFTDWWNKRSANTKACTQHMETRKAVHFQCEVTEWMTYWRAMEPGLYILTATLAFTTLSDTPFTALLVFRLVDHDVWQNHWSCSAKLNAVGGPEALARPKFDPNLRDALSVATDGRTKRFGNTRAQTPPDEQKLHTSIVVLEIGGPRVLATPQHTRSLWTHYQFDEPKLYSSALRLQTGGEGALAKPRRAYNTRNAVHLHTSMLCTSNT